MAQNKTFDIDLLTLDDIEISNASISNNTGISDLEIGTYAFESKYAVFPALNLEYNKIRIEFTVDIGVILKAKPPRNEEQFTDIKANFKLYFYFTFPNLANLIEIQDEEKANIDGDFSYNLLNIVYSTSRGIVFTRCQGTIFFRNILPVLSDEKLESLFYTQYENKQ